MNGIRGGIPCRHFILFLKHIYSLLKRWFMREYPASAISGVIPCHRFILLGGHIYVVH